MFGSSFTSAEDATKTDVKKTHPPLMHHVTRIYTIKQIKVATSFSNAWCARLLLQQMTVALLRFEAKVSLLFFLKTKIL